MINQTATCVYQPLSCDSGSQCVLGTCDVLTDHCILIDRTCPQTSICQDVSCDPLVGCVYTNHSCDDHNPCTLDYCNETVGCYHRPKCVDGLYCTDDVCLLDGTCWYPAINCHVTLTTNQTSCFVSACDEQRHCYVTPSPTAFLDVCGHCVNTFGINMTSWNATACIGTLTWPKFAATLTAAAVAGIIIAAIIGAVVVAISGIFGTRELIRRARAAQDQVVVNNPIYTANQQEGTNPFYQEGTPQIQIS